MSKEAVRVKNMLSAGFHRGGKCNCTLGIIASLHASKEILWGVFGNDESFRFQMGMIVIKGPRAEIVYFGEKNRTKEIGRRVVNFHNRSNRRRARIVSSRTTFRRFNDPPKPQMKQKVNSDDWSSLVRACTVGQIKV